MSTTKPARRRLYTVTLSLASWGPLSTRVLGCDQHDATGRGIAKLFGRRARWHADSGVRGFGQVVAGTNCLTPTVRLAVEAVAS
jgi:hypothetical protein